MRKHYDQTDIIFCLMNSYILHKQFKIDYISEYSLHFVPAEFSI